MSLPAFAARRRVSIGMLTVTLVLFGLIGLGGLPVNLLPDLSWPTLTVRTTQEGAAPLEVENLLTDPIEEALGVVKGVRRVHSVSRTGQSDVSLDFAWGTDMDMAGLEVRDKLDMLQLPLEADKPLLLRFNPSADPIMRLALGMSEDSATDSRQMKRLRRFADEELKKRIEPVTGVAAVKVGGGLEEQIDIVIDQQQLARLGLDIGVVINRLRAENINVSGGRIDEGDQRYLVRTVNQFADLEAMRGMLVTVDKQIPVYLRDIAEVGQGHKEREGVVRINGREAIELAIYKEADANTVAVARGVRAALARLDDALPEGTQLDTIEDQSQFIGQALAQVRGDAVLGGLLAVLVIFFFLGHAWSTLIISLSLPVSLIATFFLMEQFGLSLNVMSLGGLALATGMVVDDSIVVLENIARLRDKGMSAVQAAVAGASEVSMAVTASTLTTIAVFVPLIFVHGIAGELFRDQALTITFAMLISLLVAMTLIPMLATLGSEGANGATFTPEGSDAASVATHGWAGAVPRALVWLVAAPARIVARLAGKPLQWLGLHLVRQPYERVAAAYHRKLPTFLAHPGKVLGSAAIIFIATMALLPTLGMDLIPQLAQNRFDVIATLPPGTPLAQTDALLRDVAALHAKDSGVQSIHGVAGSGTRLDASPTDAGENVARWSVALKGDVDSRGELEQMERMRRTLAGQAGVEVTISRPQLFSFAAPLEIELRGYDLAALDRAAIKLTGLLQDAPRFTDIKSTVESGHPEIAIRFDQQRAAAFGLATRDIADQVMRKMRGEVATQYSQRDRKIDVRVRALPGQRDSLESIGELVVGHAGADGAGQPIRLSAVADIERTHSPGQIHHAGQQRAAVVSTGIAHGDLGAALAEVRELIAANPLGAGVDVHLGGQGEELGESSRSLLFALVLAIFLVYLVMASQFESLLHPFIIMFSIPLAAVGAVLALKLTGAAVSIVVFIGLILLVGIVVKNAIVLVDRINQLRMEGVAKREAIAQAAQSRLRPIVMTTLSTLIGFMPLALASGEGAEVRAPMAITVMGGLAVSTLLTLVVIPVLYDLLDRRADAWYVARHQRAQHSQALAGEAA